MEELERRAERYFRSDRAPNTVKSYRYDLEHFATWQVGDTVQHGCLSHLLVLTYPTLTWPLSQIPSWE